MADSVEMQDIRGLDIDKAVKGFALTEYIFKNDCNVSSTNADAVRWYQETAADLTATAPSYIANVSPLSTPAYLEPTWTRNTSYVRSYKAESFISMEDMATADLDVLARTLLRLTRAVVKQVDTRIWNVMTENQTAVNINSITVKGNWDAPSTADIIQDIMSGQMLIMQNDYDPKGATLYLSPADYKSLVTWVISTKGSSIPNFSSEKISTGTIMQFLGLNIKVSNNVTADKAAIVIPKQACTWKSLMDTTARVIEEPGIGKRIRVWEVGEAILTDPKAVCLLNNTQA